MTHGKRHLLWSVRPSRGPRQANPLRCIGTAFRVRAWPRPHAASRASKRASTMNPHSTAAPSHTGQRHFPKIRYGEAPSASLIDHTARNMHALGPTADVLAEWQQAGLVLPDLRAMRRYRVERVREQLRAANCDGAVLYDPLNVRYATDTTNMSLWTMHNAVRYAFVATDGPVIVFEFSDARVSLRPLRGRRRDPPRHLAAPLLHRQPGRTRSAGAGRDEISDAARRTRRGQPAPRRRHAGPRRAYALWRRRASSLVSGHAMMEEARLVKSADEILRHALRGRRLRAQYR